MLSGGDLGWTDLGETRRVLTVLGRNGVSRNGLLGAREV